MHLLDALIGRILDIRQMYWMHQTHFRTAQTLVTRVLEWMPRVANFREMKFGMVPKAGMGKGWGYPPHQLTRGPGGASWASPVGSGLPITNFEAYKALQNACGWRKVRYFFRHLYRLIGPLLDIDWQNIRASAETSRQPGHFQVSRLSCVGSKGLHLRTRLVSLSDPGSPVHIML